jgi:hypothetical protein
MNTVQPGEKATLEAGGMYQVTNNSNQTGNYIVWESDPSLGKPYSIPASSQQTFTCPTSPVKTATYWFANTGPVPLELQAT